MKIAVVYIRVSTEEQSKHGFSVETQSNTCLEFAEKQGYIIKRIFVEEGLSAGSLKRPEAQKLLQYCNDSKNGINAIIVWRLDRLSRFCVDYHGTIRPILINKNIKLLSATEFNSDTIEGEYMRNIMMCNAEYELSLIRFRTKENMKTIARGGRRPAKAPIGYLNVDDVNTLHKKIIVDEATAPFIKRAFELYSTGMYSFKSLGEQLYLEGFRHPKTGEKFPPRKFDWMLHNPFYIGRFEWSGEWYEGTHTPIISKELFYRVQARFTEVDRTKKHDVKFAYTGLIKCAECGCYMTAEFKRGKNKRGHYIYYHCANSKGVHKSIKNHREEKFDNTFANILETIHLEEEHIQRLKLLASDYLKEFMEYEERVVADLKQRIEVITKRIKNSYIDKLEGRIPAGMSEEEFNSLHKEWQEEKDLLIIRLNEANISSKHVYQKIEKILRFAERLPELFLKAEPEEKKMIVTVMTKSVKFDGENLIVNLKDTFKVLQNVKKCVLETVENDNLRTHETLANIKKDPHCEGLFVNGARNGLHLEPVFLLYNITKLDECQELIDNFYNLVA